MVNKSHFFTSSKVLYSLTFLADLLWRADFFSSASTANKLSELILSRDRLTMSLCSSTPSNNSTRIFRDFSFWLLSSSSSADTNCLNISLFIRTAWAKGMIEIFDLGSWPVAALVVVKRFFFADVDRNFPRFYKTSI